MALQASSAPITSRPDFGWLGSVCLVLCVLSLSACHTLDPLPSADFSAPGWNVRHGQAVWRPAGGQEVTGELLVALRTDGSAVLQFSKPSFTLVTVQRTSSRWVAHFPPDRVISGSGPSPAKIIWLHLLDRLGGRPSSADWTWEQPEHGSWRLENRRTGELLEGYLAP